MPKTSDHSYVICPYCGYRHGDTWEWADAETEGDRMECHGCEKIFIFWAEHDVTYYARDIEGGQVLKEALHGKPGAT